MDHTSLLAAALLGVVFFLLVVAAWGWLGRGLGRLPYFSRQTLLSKAETTFYHCLLRALPRGVGVAPKVRLADLIDCDLNARKAGFAARINQKHVDFVLFDVDSTAFLLVIELDDQSHRQRRAIEADEFKNRALAAAGIPILRVVAKANYNPADIRSAIATRM